jgi:uncharacterized cupredoxin-like copper-binding protein
MTVRGRRVAAFKHGRAWLAAAAAGAALALTPLAAAGQAPAVVQVDMGEFYVGTSREAPPGALAFDVKNSGRFGHEIVIIRSDLAANALPATDGKANEAGWQVLARTTPPAMQAGTTQRITATLTDGRYLLICNLKAEGQAGHYGRGMVAALTVRTGATITAPPPPPAAAQATGTPAAGAAPAAPRTGNAGLSGDDASAGIVVVLGLLAVATLAGGRALSRVRR